MAEANNFSTRPSFPIRRHHRYNRLNRFHFEPGWAVQNLLHRWTAQCFKHSSGTSPLTGNISDVLPRRSSTCTTWNYVNPALCKGQSDHKITDTEFIVNSPRPLLALRVDLWDLGEFNQENTTRTKRGTFQELNTHSQVARRNKMLSYFDVVLNQKAGADRTELYRAIQVDPESIAPYLDLIWGLDPLHTIGEVRRLANGFSSLFLVAEINTLLWNDIGTISLALIG